jgi:NAD(P)-dependent dehydrogenase (short-subunit alcohol dehydrogenase family)
VSTGPHDVVVTGAASGIGRAVALRLLAGGAGVLAVDVSEAGLADVAEAGARTCVADLSRADDRRRVVDQAAGVDALVNAAGVIRLVPPLQVSEDDWDTIFAVNAKALFFLCQAFAERLPDGGRIVNLASVAARNQSTLETAVYAASKAAVVAITRTYAHLLGPRGICVNAVLPGIVETPMQDKVIAELAQHRGVAAEDIAAKRLSIVPLGRTAPPAECAEAIVALLGPAGSYVTGQAIAVDGGYTMV